MDLTTTDRCKVHIGGETLGTGHDSFLGELIDLYSKQAERLMNRSVATATYTDYLDVEPGQCVFSLRAFPVTTLSAIYSDISRSFDVTAISSENYAAYTGSGMVIIDKYALSCGPRVLKVVYVGGMATGTTTFYTNYPDIANAVEMQVAYHFSRRKTLGKTAEGMGAGNISWQGPLDWLPFSRKVLEGHRRHTFGR